MVHKFKARKQMLTQQMVDDLELVAYDSGTSVSAVVRMAIIKDIREKAVQIRIAKTQLELLKTQAG